MPSVQRRVGQDSPFYQFSWLVSWIDGMGTFHVAVRRQFYQLSYQGQFDIIEGRMIRLITKHIRVGFSNFHQMQSPDPESMAEFSKQPFFEPYSKGIRLTFESKLPDANQSLREALTVIKDSGQESYDHYTFILKKILKNHIDLGWSHNAEDNLYEIIRHKKQVSTNYASIYDEYQNLFTLMLTYDQAKAAKLCKALLSEKQKQKMPPTKIKQFHFNLGNAYLAMGNYVDAKAQYWECLQLQPQKQLQVYTLNNLGLACWWAKNPKYQSPRDPEADASKVTQEYEQSQGLFKKALYVSETKDTQREPHEKVVFEDVLMQNTLQETVAFTSPQSVKPLYNLIQFYINNCPMKVTQLVYWLQMTRGLAKDQEEAIFDEVLVKSYVLAGTKEELLKMLPEMIHKYEGTFDELRYLKLLAMLNKTSEEAQRYMQRAQALEAQLSKSGRLQWERVQKQLCWFEMDLS